MGHGIGHVLAEIVYSDEAVIQDGFGAVVSLPRFKWCGELNECPLGISTIPHLQCRTRQGRGWIVYMYIQRERRIVCDSE